MNELKHFGNSFGGPDKDICVSCGMEKSTYYSYQGVCKECRDKEENNNKVNRMKGLFMRLLVLGFIIAAIVALSYT